jgi:hypothetical protein
VRKRPWEQQESRLANITGGTRNSGSGNGWVRKGDVRARVHYLIEAKWTEKKSFVLKLADLRTLEHHAVIDGREPAFCIEFSERIGPGHHVSRRYVVLLEDQVFGDDDPHLPDAG